MLGVTISCRPTREGVLVAADPADRVLHLGDWAVMDNGGMLHLAETVGGLPRGRAVCGAVGTAFVVSSAPQPARVCEQCARLARQAGRPVLR
jgi:hypothetical protein